MKKNRFSRVVILTALTLVGGLLPVLPVHAAPTVKLLNPSGYSGANLRISAKEDANGNTSYHLVAWAGDVPSNPLVEFEVASTPGLPGTGPGPEALATVTATRVGGSTGDTFEGQLSTSTLPDGQYFLRAILYGGFLGPGTGSEVARDEQPVTIQSGATALNTVELAYPQNGGPFGFWRTGTNPGAGVVNGFASEGTAQVRVLYSTTAPGNAPEWAACGSGSTSQNQFRVRCTLDEEVNPGSVRAIAAVANRTPSPGPATQSGDETGDAHRVLPYVQNPSVVTLDPASSQTEQDKCTPITATVNDQSGIPVAGLNVDIHAQGPDDQLRFGTLQVNGINQHSSFQPPDAAHTGLESTRRCAPTDPENQQGDHNVPASPDLKHIESTPNGGTNNAGQFTFFLHSATKGGTQITVWGDENDDDNLNASNEATGTGQLGWGEPAPPARTVLSLDPSSASGSVGDCERLVATATQNGAAQASRNVDVHINGPNDVAFCNPGDATVTEPDSGGHTGDADVGAQNTYHAEGTSNSSGQIIFGVTSPNPGDTSVTAWLDENDNDVHDGTESATAGTIDWLGECRRDISLEANKRRVRKGRKVTFSGQVSCTDTCNNTRTHRVKIKARKGKKRFRNFAATTTNNNGAYSVTKRVKKTKRYRAIAPKTGSCNRARSNVIKVRVRR